MFDRRLHILPVAAIGLSLAALPGCEKPQPKPPPVGGSLDTAWRDALIPNRQSLPLTDDLLERIVAAAQQSSSVTGIASEATGKPSVRPDELQSEHFLQLLQQSERNLNAISALDPLVRAGRSPTIVGSDILLVAYEDHQRVFSDSRAQQKLASAYGEPVATFKPDCSEHAAVLLSAVLLRQLDAPKEHLADKLSLVGGVYIHPEDVPNGVYHEWVEFNGVICDASLSGDTLMVCPDGAAGYIPLVRGNVQIVPNGASAYRIQRSLEVYFLPSDVEGGSK